MKLSVLKCALALTAEGEVSLMAADGRDGSLRLQSNGTRADSVFVTAPLGGVKVYAGSKVSANQIFELATFTLRMQGWQGGSCTL